MSSSSKVDDSEPPPPSSYITPPALIAFTLALIVVCFVGFSVLYFCRFYFVSILHTRPFQRSGASTLLRRISSPNDDASSSPYRGLDPLLLQAFPTFLYASVKDLRKDHKYSLECAICLLEFEDDSMLRLLNPCCHVFHQECIDLWLSSNKTCPVCRKHLDSPFNGAQKCEEHGDDEDDNVHVEEESMGDVCIDVKEDEVDHHRHHDDDDEDDEAVSVSTGLQQHRELRTFARSHSTGHSIIMNRGEDEGKDNDKYTLRLREHVAVIKNVGGGARGRGRGRVGHNYSKSCSSYRYVTRPNVPCSNCGYVETVSGCSSRTGTQHI